MKVEFTVTDDEARRAREFLDTWSMHRFVAARIRRNVEGLHARVDEGEFWDALVSALLTTQQRSGPASAVTRLIRTVPLPLRIDACRGQTDAGAFVESVLAARGGIRRGPTIGRELKENLARLEAGEWRTVISVLDAIDGTPFSERRAARYLDACLVGVGPKQARNIPQMLGLTRFETPVDSRVMKWLNGFGFPLAVSAAALADQACYELVSDGFQALCRAADVFPCVMDAAIFASFDGDDYGEDVMRW